MSMHHRLSLAGTGCLACIVLCVVFWNDVVYSRFFDLHASCYNWLPSLIALHVSSDFFTGCAYVFISVMLFLFVLRLHLPFSWIFFCFGAFIICCGITHFMEIVTTLWTPVYWLSGSIKAVTALASVGTALLLPPLLPKVQAAVASARKANEQGRELTHLYAKLEQAYYTLADNMPLLLWTCDAKGENRYFNAAWQTFTGMSMEELLHEEVRSRYVSDEDIDRIRAMWTRAFEAKTQYDVEVRIRRFDGVYIWHLLRAIPTLEHGVITGWISTGTDIHRQKQNEQALREAKERQDMFLSMTSHELKTPLTSIQLLISFLRREVSDPKYERAIGTIEAQSKRLVRLINDLLDTSRAQQDRLALTFTTFDVFDFTQSVIRTLQSVTPSHQLTLTIEQSVEASVLTPVLLRADKDRIEQVLVNLLTNAIKYSPEANRVDASVKVEADTVTFAVRDYGIGIAHEAQEHIFEQYYRSIEKANIKYSGLGIGLYIAYEIVKRHRGRIWVRSEEGKGSTFFFSLPIGIENE